MHLSAKPAVAVGHKHALLQPKGFPQPFHDGRNSLRSAGYDKSICQSWPAENFRENTGNFQYSLANGTTTAFSADPRHPTICGMADPHVISALREKRALVSGQALADGL